MDPQGQAQPAQPYRLRKRDLKSFERWLAGKADFVFPSGEGQLRYPVEEMAAFRGTIPDGNGDHDGNGNGNHAVNGESGAEGDTTPESESSTAEQ